MRHGLGVCPAENHCGCLADAPTDHTAAIAEAARKWRDTLDPSVSVADHMAAGKADLLDRLAHMTEARDNARAEVGRLTGQIEAAKRICLGTHLGRPWHAVLDDVLRALDGAES